MIRIDMEMPLSCRRCNFAIKVARECKCLANNNKLHESWFEKSLDEPMRPTDCPLYSAEGKWEKEGYKWICSRCGLNQDIPTRFCPSCGAHMDKE